MYHLAKVIMVYKPDDDDVISGDQFTQATVQMWDDVPLTVAVEPRIAHEVKEGDVVVIDYTSVNPDREVSRRVIVKIIRGPRAEKIWKVYWDYGQKKAQEKKEAQAMQKQPVLKLSTTPPAHTPSARQ